MAKSGGYRSSANRKKDLKKAQFDMSGVFLEAPTVREQDNIVRKQQAYGQNLDQKSEMEMQIAQKEAEVAGLQRAQQGREVSREEQLRGRRSRLELQMLNQNYNKLNEGLLDDVYGGTQDTVGEMGSPIIDETVEPVPTVTPQRDFTTPEQATGAATMPEIRPLGTGPAATIGGGDTNVSSAATINALLSIPEEDRTPAMWQTLADLLPNEYDRTQAADREEVDPDPDSPDRPGKIAKSRMTYQQKMQLAHDSHAMGRRVEELLDQFAYDDMGKAERRQEMMRRINDGTFEVETVADFFEGILATHEELKRLGAPSALSDVALHSVLHQVREAYKRIGEPDDRRGRQEAIDNSQIAPTEEETAALNLVMRGHEVREIGNKILEAMGVKPDANNVNSTIAGTIARDLVVRAFPNLFVKDLKGNIQISSEGLTVAERLLPMTQTILPHTKNNVRLDKKPSASNVVRPRSGAKLRRTATGAADDVEYGNYDLVNNTLDILDNIGYTIDQDMVNIVNALTQSMDANGKTNIDKLIGTGKEDTGTLNNRSGTRKKKDPTTGRDVIGPDGQPEMEWYPGDRIKDVIFNDNMDWAENLGKNVFYYDHFLGDNNRFYISQFTGNYHSHKLVRAMLMSDRIEMFSVDNEASLNELKAGIVKKFGHNVGVAEAARIFDANAKTWNDMIMNVREDGASIIDLAADKDGWDSVSAMVEATKLHQHLEALKNGTKTDPIYTTKFMTHVDGTGNGLAHNAMQAGDFKTAALTNINPMFNAPEGVARMGWEEASPLNNDVYNLTGAGMTAQVEKNQSASSGFVKQAIVALGLDNKSNMRQFSKAPLMIFQYGAGRALIKRIVKENVLIALEEDPATAAAFNQIVLEMGGNALSQSEIKQAIQDGVFQDSGQFRDADFIIDQMGDMMVKSVETNFPMLKELSNILSSMANAAALHSPPIDLSVITIGGHRLNFGLANWETDRLRSFIDETSGLDFSPAEKILYPQGTKVYMKNQASGKNISIKNTNGHKMPNPNFNPQYPEHPIKNPKYVPLGSLKSATQAAVLMTHSLDGINVARSLGAWNQDKRHMSIAQIFDGFLVSPKHAREFSERLNKDFLDIHLDKGGRFRTTGDFMDDLTDVEKFQPGQSHYDFLSNNPANSNVLLLYRAMAKKGFNWDDYKGKGLIKKIKDFEKRRKAFRRQFIKDFMKDSEYNYKAVKQFFWD